MSAKRYWNADLFESPDDEFGPEKVQHLLRSIVAATKTEKPRLWQYRLEYGSIELLANSGSAAQMQIEDRDLMICCGSILFQIKLALKQLGCLGAVDLFPDIGDARLVARIHYNFFPKAQPQDISSLEEVEGLQKIPPSTEGTALSETVLDAFRSAVGREKAWLEFSRCESSRKQLLELAQGDMQRSVTLPTTRHFETSFGIRVGVRGGLESSSSSSDGRGNSRPAWWKMPFFKFTDRAFGSNAREPGSDSRFVTRTAELGVIKTKTDDNYGWLAAGQAMARVQLQAQVSGLQMHCSEESFRKKQLRERLRTAMGRKGFVQAIIGLEVPAIQFRMLQPRQYQSPAPRASV